MAEVLTLKEQIEYHLQNNLPLIIPVKYADICVEALTLINEEGNQDKILELPEGLTWYDKKTYTPHTSCKAFEIIHTFQLYDFITKEGHRKMADARWNEHQEEVIDVD